MMRQAPEKAVEYNKPTFFSVLKEYDSDVLDWG
jgi:hypothetical protein